MFLVISQPKMVRFSFRKKLRRGGNALFQTMKLANAHGRLLGVLRYKGPVPPKIVFCISLKKVVFWCLESVFCILIHIVSIFVYCHHNLRPDFRYPNESASPNEQFFFTSLYNNMRYQSCPVYCKMKSVFCILDGYFGV